MSSCSRRCRRDRPDPATNDDALLHPDALAAARTWADEHGHQQPDDRMLAAYGRVLAGLVAAQIIADLASATELAESTVVSPQAVRLWASRFPDFPKPLAVLRGGTLYSRAEVKAWRLAHGGHYATWADMTVDPTR